MENHLSKDKHLSDISTTTTISRNMLFGNYLPQVVSSYK